MPAFSLPAELASLKTFLIWRARPRNDGSGKIDKVPYYADGQIRRGEQGAPADVARFVDLATATAAAAGTGPDGLGFSGVGLALTEHHDFSAIDFDDCVDEAGRVIEAVALCTLGTYSEFSPSRRGVRVLVAGKLAAEFRDKKSLAVGTYGVEAFSMRGFVTLTGNITDICDIGGWESTITQPNDHLLSMMGARFGRADRKRGGVPVPGGETRVGLSDESIDEVLSFIDPDCNYEMWRNVLMGLHHETSGSPDGFQRAMRWCMGGVKWNTEGEGRLENRWNGFGKRAHSVTFRSAMKYARANGWSGGAVSHANVAAMFPVLPPTPPVIGANGITQRPAPTYERSRITGLPIKSGRNLLTALGELAYRGTEVVFDEFTSEFMFHHSPPGGAVEARPLRDADYTMIRFALTEFHDLPEWPLDTVREVVNYRAMQRTIDSAKEWIRSLTWDRVPRVDDFFHIVFGVEKSAYTTAVSRYFWSALAGRIIQPGVKADMVPVLCGNQGVGKSLAVARIAPIDPHGNKIMSCEISLSMRDDDLARTIRGKNICEIADLSGLATRELEAIKALITRQIDQWVPKYVEHATKSPRRCIFVGTTNEERFLADVTGNRRFLPLHVTAVDIDYIDQWRDQLYAEAAEIFKTSGVEYRLANDLAESTGAREACKHVDPWTPVIDKWLTTPDALSGARPCDGPFITTLDVLTYALGKPARDVNPGHSRRVVAALVSLGYVPTRIYDENGKRWRVYVKNSGGTG